MPVVLRMPATVDSLPVIRQVATGVAAACGMDEERLEDVRVAVTEACTNAVHHAYQGEPGVLTLAAWLAAGDLLLSVRDRGRGIPEGDDPEALGLLVVRALADDVGIRSGAHGTELTMRFAVTPVS